MNPHPLARGCRSHDAYVAPALSAAQLPSTVTGVTGSPPIAGPGLSTSEQNARTCSKMLVSFIFWPFGRPKKKCFAKSFIWLSFLFSVVWSVFITCCFRSAFIRLLGFFFFFIHIFFLFYLWLPVSLFSFFIAIVKRFSFVDCFSPFLFCFSSYIVSWCFAFQELWLLLFCVLSKNLLLNYRGAGDYKKVHLFFPFRWLVLFLMRKILEIAWRAVLSSKLPLGTLFLIMGLCERVISERGRFIHVSYQWDKLSFALDQTESDAEGKLNQYGGIPIRGLACCSNFIDGWFTELFLFNEKEDKEDCREESVTTNTIPLITHLSTHHIKTQWHLSYHRHLAGILVAGESRCYWEEEE